MKIFVIGTVAFSERVLQHLLENLRADVVGVATKEASAFNADFVSLAPLSATHGVPCRFVKDINAPEILDWIRSLAPDVVLCVGWSSLIKTELLHLAPLGVVGYHPAALPRNRGRHPIIWALVLGLTETASTFFFMDEGADSGDILSQQTVAISPADDAASLYEKLTLAALDQISTFVPALAAGTYQRQPQDHTNANTWRKRGRADGRLDFRMTSQALHNLVRGLTRPYVGAHVEVASQDVKVWQAASAADDRAHLEPGQVLAHLPNGAFRVKTSDGALDLLEHEFSPLPGVGTYL